MHAPRLLGLLVVVGLLGTSVGPGDAHPGPPGLELDAVRFVGPAATWTCDDVVLDPAGDAAYDAACPAGGAIRPGVRGNGCTLSWIVTDGTDIYVTTAGHCGGVGRSFSVSGVGTIGSVVFRESNGDVTNLRDWAFIKIDPAKHAFVDPTMVHHGGPTTLLPDLGDGPVRTPIPGDVVLHHGHGAGLGREDATKARAGIAAATLPTAFAWSGSVGPGDSGSPVRLGTGEAAGIVVVGGVVETGDNTGYVPGRCEAAEAVVPGACAPYWDACARLDGACTGVWRPGGLYGVVVATRLDVALDAFEAHLGRDAWVVAGQGLGVRLA